MKKILLLLVFVVSVFSFTGCEEDITVDLPEYQTKLVVYCVLNPDSMPKLFLSRSKSYFDYSDTSHEFNYISDALVTITESGSGNIDTLKPTEGFYDNEGGYNEKAYGPFYLGKNKIKIGEKYILNVWHKTSHVSGETFVHAPVTLKNVTFKMEETQFGPMYLFDVKFDDDAAYENAYRLNFYNWQQFGLGEWDLVKTNNGFENDQITNGREVTLQIGTNFYDDPMVDSNIVYVSVDNATRQTADFIESAFNQMYNDGNPFTEPVMIRSNIVGGIGVFGAYSPSAKYRVKLR